MGWAYFVLGLVFIVVVIPMWLRLHYRRRETDAAGLSADERRELEALRDRARRLEERLSALERVLSAQTPPSNG
jgi:phage shock protein B